jgi:hypothetical protein
MKSIMLVVMCIAASISGIAQDTPPTSPQTTVTSEWSPNSKAKISRDTLYVGYTNALADIELKVQKAKGDVLGKYGKALDNALATLKTKGLFDDYKLVLKESDRFSTEKTIPVDPNSTHPSLATAITECQKQLLNISNKAKELEIENTKNYVKALRELVKQTMIKNMMGDAEKINEEIKSLSGIIPEPTTGLVSEKTESAGSRQPKETLTWKDITSTFEGGKRLAVGIVLQGNEITSKESYKPPVEVEYVCKTDSTNIRIKYACKELIFNWECDKTQLRIDAGPAGGQHRAGAGMITPNKFVTIRQVVLPDKMEIYVDNELRGSWDADFSTVDSPIGIRSPSRLAPLPTITVKSVRVRVPAKVASSVSPTDTVTPKLEPPVASPADGTRFVVECNGNKVTNALIVVYAGGGTGYPFMTWGRQVIECGITQADGVKLKIPPGKYKYQVNVFASGYQFYSGKDEEIKGEKFVIKIKKQSSTRGADRWIYLPLGTGVPVFSNSKDPEIEVVFISHTSPPHVKTVNSDISFPHGLKQVTTYKTFEVFKGDVAKKPQSATCQPIWYFGLNGRDCPSGLVLLVNEK